MAIGPEELREKGRKFSKERKIDEDRNKQYLERIQALMLQIDENLIEAMKNAATDLKNLPIVVGYTHKIPPPISVLVEIYKSQGWREVQAESDEKDPTKLRVTFSTEARPNPPSHTGPCH